MRKKEKSFKLKNKDVHKTRTKNDVLYDIEQNIVNYENNAIISSYNGDKKNGKAHGNGTAKMKNGNTYIGNWVEGRMEGEGLLYQDRISSKYFGDFKNNLPDGKGRETHYSKGKWYEWYEGGFSEGKRHGLGVIRDKNGYKYNVKYDHGRLISKEIKQQDYRKHDDYSTDDSSVKEDKTTEVSNNVAKVNAKKKYRDITINLMGKNKSIGNYGEYISPIRKERESIIILPDEENISISKEIKQQDYRKHDDYLTDDNSDEEDKTTEVSNNVAKVNANKSIGNYGEYISPRRKRRESIIIDEENISNDDYKLRNNINDDNKNEKKSNFLHQSIKYSKGISSVYKKPHIQQYHKGYNNIKQCDNKTELIFTRKRIGRFSKRT